MSGGIWRGAASGAAGTTVLNAVTYLDMTVRGRATSSTPEQLVEEVAGRVGITVPGDDDARANRLQGLGPLSGSAVGVAVGIGAGLADALLRRSGRQVPAPLAVLVIGGAAMALSDVPLKAFGISDPATWAARDWAADVVPHLAYGAATYATLRGLG
ncbi:hypothetical protein [uncultured Friedmanniella sp.]|uniref:hypothetical protein n=1 Tax=uncultured Friedmanniella sp. TaxID=335381 RepID=UPI0035CA46C9